jgi:S-DNA-T family DNA segregation ATPase FtsK/SpoIIIE
LINMQQRALKALRVVGRWPWRCVAAGGRHLVTYWPGLAYLAIAVRMVRAWPGWAWLARGCRAGGRGLGRLAVVLCRVVARVGLWLGRVGVRAGRWTWTVVEPYVRDASGWLVHTAPRLAVRALGRLLVRVVRLGLPALFRLLGLAVLGGWWLLVRLVRYVFAYPEYAPLVRELEEDGRARRALAARNAWRRAFYRRITGCAVVTLVVGLFVAGLVDRFGARAVLGLVVVTVVIMAGVGGATRPRADRAEEAVEERGEEEPYPIADAHTRAEAADCVARAVRAEGIELRMAGDAHREPWGWAVPIVLRRGTPAAVVAKLGELETTLDLPSGGLLAAPDRARRARVVLRLAERDPFAGLLPAPAHLPASLSIRDAHVVGQRMDGTDLALCLLGVHGVMIGTPGAGKSMTLRTLADAISACRDAVVWDLDPSGNGLDVLGPAAGRREREPAGIEDALADARALAEARPRMFTDLGMGDAWQPSRDRPAVVVVIDEYPRLSDRAKALAVDLIRVGRKARVTVLLAASEATSDTLGAAIADTAALKILMPCRHADVRLVLGPNMIAEGWRPDRLNPATGDSPEDAGCCYVHAASAREPVVSKIRTLDGPRAREQGAHRGAQGLPRIDAQSWTAARARRQAEHGADTSPPGDRQAARDVLSVFGDEPKLWTDEILSRLSTLDDRYATWGAEDLSAALRPFGVTPVQVWRHGRNRNGYERAALVAALRS